MKELTSFSVASDWHPMSNRSS